MLEQARESAKQRSALRLGDLSEEERRLIEVDADVLAPFRNIVLVVGASCLFGAFYDGLLLVARGPRLFPRAEGNMDEMNSSTLVLNLFLTLVGAVCLYAGSVWMAPPPLPTVQELLDKIEQGEDEEEAASKDEPATAKAKAEADEAPMSTRSPKLLKMMAGTWCYGIARLQTFSLGKEGPERPWRYEEELNGTAYAADLYPKKGWLQGELADKEGNISGEIRFQPGRGDFVISNFRLPGEDAWSVKNKAYRAESEEE